MHEPATTRRWSVGDEEIARLARAARAVFEDIPEVIAVYLYGSAARGEAAADLDVALLLGRPLPPARLEVLAATLQLEGASAGPEIDLRTLWGAGPRYQITVLREGRLLFERDLRRRLALEAQVMSRWADFKPTWERMRDRLHARWRTHG